MTALDYVLTYWFFSGLLGWLVALFVVGDARQLTWVWWGCAVGWAVNLAVGVLGVWCFGDVQTLFWTMIVVGNCFTVATYAQSHHFPDNVGLALFTPWLAVAIAVGSFVSMVWWLWQAARLSLKAGGDHGPGSDPTNPYRSPRSF